VLDWCCREVRGKTEKKIRSGDYTFSHYEIGQKIHSNSAGERGRAKFKNEVRSGGDKKKNLSAKGRREKKLV